MKDIDGYRRLAFISSLILIIGIIEINHKIGVLAGVDIDCDKTSLIVCIVFMETILDLCGKGAYRS